MSFESREHLYGYFFVVPALLFMLAFVGYPIVYNILLSLQDVNVMTFSQKTKAFVGLANYQQLLQGEMIFITLKNNTLDAVIENSKAPGTAPNPQGIGLQNVRRQLELLYPGRHELDLADEQSRFRVRLKINLAAPGGG